MERFLVCFPSRSVLGRVCMMPMDEIMLSVYLFVRLPARYDGNDTLRTYETVRDFSLGWIWASKLYTFTGKV